jgi:hypothetical protein
MAISIYLTDVYGYRLAELTGYSNLECVSGQNLRGGFTLEFPAQQFPRALFFQSGAFAIDRRIEVWRASRGRDLRLIFCGFVRLYEETAPDYAYTEDYTDEGTFCYAGGSGKEAARVYTNAQNDARLVATPLNRREIFYQNTNEADPAVLADGARAELYENRPKINFVPRNIELDYIYPHEWGLGDELRISSGQATTITVGGPDLNDLLARRVIAYATGTAEAKKSQEADDMLKAYVYENLGAGALAARQLPATLGFEQAADTASAPSVEYSATYGNLLEVLKRVADRAAENGTRVYFGVIPVMRAGRIVPRFETRITRWGHDRTILDIGSGARQQNLLVAGVRVTVNGNTEKITPRFAEVDDA